MSSFHLIGWKFKCKHCNGRAFVEELSEGIFVLACDVCDVNEMWLYEDPFENLDHFQLEPLEAKA